MSLELLKPNILILFVVAALRLLIVVSSVRMNWVQTRRAFYPIGPQFCTSALCLSAARPIPSALELLLLVTALVITTGVEQILIWLDEPYTRAELPRKTRYKTLLLTTLNGILGVCLLVVIH